MAERRRIIPASVGPDFNGSHDQPEKPTRRFTVTLPEPSDKTSPEFSYTDLVKEAGGVVEEEKSFNDLDEDDLTGLAALARKFEEKYGEVKGKKKRKRLEDVVDAGLGYDETDPFVDNSECYDELVPSVLTTKFGGFYINSGELQFKELSGESDDSDFQVTRKRKKYQKRKKKKPLDSDDEKQSKPKKRPLSGSSDGGGGTKKKLKKKLQRQLSGGIEEKKKKKKKLNLPKAPTIAELLKTKENNPERNPKDKNSNGLNIHNGPDPLQDAHRLGADMDVDGLDRIDPSMDIGVPNLPMDSEMAAVLSDTLAGMGEGDDLPDMDTSNLQANGEQLEEQVLIPADVPSRLEKDINRIKEAARKSVEGKTKFFTPAINSLLLEIENQSRELSCGKRSSIYNHLAYHLPCTKDTLLKRAKKLRLGAQDSQLKEPIQRLKEAISEVMPAQIERYQDECTAAEQARQERIDEEEKNERNASQDEDEEKSKGPRSYTPRRKFIWTDHLRDLLCQVVSIKLKTYEMSKTRSQSAEDYLKAFLETDIKPLWPNGWMQTRMLFKESRSVHSPITSMPPKLKKLNALPKKLASKKLPDGTPTSSSAPGSEATTPNDPKEISPKSISPYSENSLSPSSMLVQGAKEFPTLLDYADSPGEPTNMTLQEDDDSPKGQKSPADNKDEAPCPSEDETTGTLSLLASAMSEVVKKLEKERNSGDESAGSVIEVPFSNEPVVNRKLPEDIASDDPESTNKMPGAAGTYGQSMQELSGSKSVPSIRSPQSSVTSSNQVSPVAHTSEPLMSPHTQQPSISPHSGEQLTIHPNKSPHEGVSGSQSHSSVQVIRQPGVSPRGGVPVTQQPSSASPHGSTQVAGQPSASLQGGGQVIRQPVKSPHSGVQVTQQPRKSPHGNVQVTQPPSKSPHVGVQVTRQPMKGPHTGVQVTQQPRKGPHGSVQVTRQPNRTPQGSVQVTRQPIKSPQGNVRVTQQSARQPHRVVQVTRQPVKSSQVMQRPLKNPQSSMQVTQQHIKSPPGGVQATQPGMRSPHSGVQIKQQPVKRPTGGVQSAQRPLKSSHGPSQATQVQKGPFVGGTQAQRLSTAVRTHGPNVKDHKQSVFRPSPSPVGADRSSQPVVRLARQPSLEQMSSSMPASTRVTVKSNNSKVTVQRQTPHMTGTSMGSGDSLLRRTSPVTGQKSKAQSGGPLKAPSPSVSPKQAPHVQRRPSPMNQSQQRTSPQSPKVPSPAISPNQLSPGGTHRVSPSRASPSVSPYPSTQHSAVYRAMHQQTQQNVRPSLAKVAPNLHRRGSFPTMANQRVSSPMTSPTFTRSPDGPRPQMAARGFQQMSVTDPSRKASPGISAVGQNSQSNSASPTFPGMSVPGMVGRSASLDQASPPVSRARPGVIPGIGYITGQTGDDRVLYGRPSHHLLPHGMMPPYVPDPNYDQNSQGQSRLH